MTQDIRIALKAAVEDAIKEVGIAQFKKTSFFMSNDRAYREERMAA